MEPEGIGDGSKRNLSGLDSSSISGWDQAWPSRTNEGQACGRHEAQHRKSKPAHSPLLNLKEVVAEFHSDQNADALAAIARSRIDEIATTLTKLQDETRFGQSREPQFAKYRYSFATALALFGIFLDP